MTESSVQEKFEKAVNVIRNLPKNGSYQPSHELQLRFYAYFKQATEGCNTQPKPGIWQIVKKAKWDAWTKLGNMTKEEAMIHYVEELRKIVETMSYTENVATFMNSLDGFYENVPAEDLELLVGPIIEKMRSRADSPLSGSPLASRDTSPSRVSSRDTDSSPIRLNPGASEMNGNKHITSSLETSPSSSYTASPQPPDIDDDEDDNFLDTTELPSEDTWCVPTPPSSTKIERNGIKESQAVAEHLDNLYQMKHIDDPKSLTNADQKVMKPSLINDCFLKCDMINDKIKAVERKLNQGCASSSNSNHTSAAGGRSTLDTLANTIDTMTRDMENLQRRIISLENRRPPLEKGRRSGGGVQVRGWWGLPMHTTTVLLLWPILLIFISKWLSRRNSRLH